MGAYVALLPCATQSNGAIKMNFNKDVFVKAFDAAIIELAGAEKITKAVLLTLSRTVLEAHHVTQDIGYINRLVAVLTPVNRKVAILFFTEFSGFKLGKDGLFSGKDKKNYEAAAERTAVFLEDVNNNIWSWAAREVEIEAKEFDLARLKKNLESTLKKSADNGISQLQVIETLMEAGLKLDTLIALMDKVAGKEAA
jgi:hypothetical protein